MIACISAFSCIFPLSASTIFNTCSWFGKYLEVSFTSIADLKFLIWRSSAVSGITSSFTSIERWGIKALRTLERTAIWLYSPLRKYIPLRVSVIVSKIVCRAVAYFFSCAINNVPKLSLQIRYSQLLNVIGTSCSSSCNCSTVLLSISPFKFCWLMSCKSLVERISSLCSSFGVFSSSSKTNVR